jgi:hypothetical protein
MMGPLLTYQDDAHLDRLLAASFALGLQILPDGTQQTRAFWFRRRFGLVHGTCWPAYESQPMMYFGFGHPFNPLLWQSDGHLLQEIEQVFLTNGSSRVDPASLV